MAVKPPVQEWVIADRDGFVRAMEGIRKLHALNLEGLRNRVGTQTPADVIRGRQTDMRSSVMFLVTKVFNMEWVLRPSEDRENEWVFTDQESFVAALDGMRRHRGLSLQALYQKVRIRAATDILRKRQENMNSGSLITTCVVLDFELVCRKIKATSKAQRRLELLRQAKEQSQERGRGKQAPDLEITQSDPRRDERGRLRPESVLTEQERSEAEALLAQYGGYS